MFQKQLSTNSLDKLSLLGQKVVEKGEGYKAFQTLPVANIYSKAQPRTVFEHIEELADNMKAIGQQQPIVVSVDDDGRYMIEQGERRWRAAKLAKIPFLDCLVINADDKEDERLLRQLSENIQRDDMTLWDLSQSIALLVSHGLKISAIAEKLGKKVPYISVLNSITDLPKELETLVKGKHIVDPIAVNKLKKLFAEDPQSVCDQIDNWTREHEASKEDDAPLVITRAQVMAFIQGKKADSSDSQLEKDLSVDTSINDGDEESSASDTEAGEEGHAVEEETLPAGCTSIPVKKSRLAILWNGNEAYVTPGVLAPEGKPCITMKATK